MLNPEILIEEAQEAYKFDVHKYTPEWVQKVIHRSIIKAYNAGLNTAIELCDDSREILQQHLIKE